MAPVATLIATAMTLWQAILTDDRAKVAVALVLVAIALALGGDSAAAMPRTRL